MLTIKLLKFHLLKYHLKWSSKKVLHIKSEWRQHLRDLMRDHDLANYQKNWSKTYCPQNCLVCSVVDIVWGEWGSCLGPPEILFRKFRDHYKVGTKSGNYEIDSKWRLFLFFFFRDQDDFARKIGKYVIEDFFFGEHQFLRILIGILPQAPNFEYPSLGIQLW